MAGKTGAYHTGLSIYITYTQFPSRAVFHATRAAFHNPHSVSLLQANVDRTVEPAEWKLEALASKLVQYCKLLEGLTAEDLKKAGNVSWGSSSEMCCTPTTMLQNVCNFARC